MRSKTIDILNSAMAGGYSVGAFNTSNLEITQAIAKAAAKTGRPCIIQVTLKSMDYAGDRVLGDMVSSIIEHDSNSTPVGFHLDHGHNMDEVIRAIDLGCDSVMIDASRMSLKKNIEVTKRVVEYAHAKGVTVQAELGFVPYLGQEEQDINWDEVMTKPEEAKKLVDETGIDALAVGIGNAHGFFRERTEPDWERLSQIKSLVPNTPLILHGASDWHGENVKKAIQGGISCFNIDTDIRIAFTTSICKQVASGCSVADYRKILGEARSKVMQKVEEKMKLFAGE